MAWWVGLCGLGLGVAGALLVGLGDAWFSRSVLVFLDALESNLAKVVGTLKAEGSHYTITPPDVRRDRGQNRARAWKSLGWCLLALGFLLQAASLWLAAPPG